jgi:hypothetical protein
MGATIDTRPPRPPGQQGLRIGHEGKSPEARARSEANLRPDAGRKHHAYVDSVRAPLEAEHRTRLQATFPAACATPEGDDLVNASAKRCALVDRFSAFLEDRGPIVARKGQAQVEPAARELRLLLDAHERAVVQLAALEREHGAGGRDAAMTALMRARGELPAADEDPPDAELVDDQDDEEQEQ